MSDIPINPHPIPIGNERVVNVYEDDAIAIFDSLSGIPIRFIPSGSTVPPLILASIRQSGLQHFGRRVQIARNPENQLNIRGVGSGVRSTTEIERDPNQDNIQRISIEKERNENYQQLRDRAAREYRSRLQRLGVLTEQEQHAIEESNPNFLTRILRSERSRLDAQRRVRVWEDYLENRRLLANGELNERAATDLRRELERQEIVSIRNNDSYAELLGWYEIHRYGLEEAERRMRNRLASIENADTHGTVRVERNSHLTERIEARHSAVAGPFAAIGQVLGTVIRHAQGGQYDITDHTNDNVQAAGASLDGIGTGLAPLAVGALSQRRNNSRQTSISDRGLDPRERVHGAPMQPLNRDIGLGVDRAISEFAPIEHGRLRLRTRPRHRTGPNAGQLFSSLDDITRNFTTAQRRAARRIINRMPSRFQRVWRQVNNSLAISRNREVRELWRQGKYKEAKLLARDNYNNYRGRFWASVRRNPRLRQMLEEAGLVFEGGRTSAPFWKLPNGTIERLSLDHTFRVQDRPWLSTDSARLRMVPTRENSNTLEFIRDFDRPNH